MLVKWLFQWSLSSKSLIIECMRPIDSSKIIMGWLLPGKSSLSFLNKKNKSEPFKNN